MLAAVLRGEGRFATPGVGVASYVYAVALVYEGDSEERRQTWEAARSGIRKRRRMPHVRVEGRRAREASRSDT